MKKKRKKKTLQRKGNSSATKGHNKRKGIHNGGTALHCREEQIKRERKQKRNSTAYREKNTDLHQTRTSSGDKRKGGGQLTGQPKNQGNFGAKMTPANNK